MIRTQMGTRNRPEMVAVYGTPCAIRPITVTVIVILPLLGVDLVKVLGYELNRICIELHSLITAIPDYFNTANTKARH
jgi:hypothetical protein